MDIYFSGASPSSINLTFALEFYNHTNLHTCVTCVEGGWANQGTQTPTDQRRLHGSIHYSGYLTDIKVRQRNKSLGPLLSFIEFRYYQC
jgi:hypothetical protein